MNATAFRSDEDDLRRADSLVWHSGRLAFFRGFSTCGKSPIEKEPDFCLSAMCAMSANCGRMFVLAVSMNTSEFWPDADELRWPDY